VIDGTVAASVAEQQRALLAWGERTRRSLPWRATRDPWAVLVSEVMAQQTQVDRVVPKYVAFMERFPTPGACAAAPVAEVIRLWDGLGYNRRAISLHRCAIVLSEEHGGALPCDLAALQRLPGVGAYTARAVLAFAFERDVGVVDTNAARVLARWRGRALTPAEAQAAADQAVPSGQGWAWNQTMLDLAVAICSRRRPACAACPVQRLCSWHATGCSEPDPADGSAGVSSGQSAFAGSDREGRGRLVAALRRAPVPARDLPQTMGWPDDLARAERVAASVIADGLAVRDDLALRLP
jgi:A/G-specific adenine glycosylase